MAGSNAVRAVLGTGLAVAVWQRQDLLPDPNALAAGGQPSNDMALYATMMVIILIMGLAEVLYDNSAQTFVPSVLPGSQLEKGNGRLWSAEMVANELAGPPLGALLLAAFFALPFFLDAATFALSAVLVLAISPATLVRPDNVRAPGGPAQANGDTNWRDDLVEGVRWLWSHQLLRTLAIILGLMNMVGTMTWSIIVLFSQEVLTTSTTEFALMGTGGAIGGALGGWTASRISGALGEGPSLYTTLATGIVVNAGIGLTSRWTVAWVLLFFFSYTGVLWNVITVSLRQTIIPDQLLGRVNSVYRFFGWGAIPIGAALGGLIVVLSELVLSRSMALRMPFLVAAAAHVVLLAVALPGPSRNRTVVVTVKPASRSS